MVRAALLSKPSKLFNKNPRLVRTGRGFLLNSLEGLLGDAACTINGQNANALAGTEHLVRLDLLHISTGAAVVFTNGNFNTLGLGQTRLSGRTQQATRYSTDHRGHDAATATADGAATHTTNNRAGCSTDWGFGPLDLHRTQGNDGTHATGLNTTRFIARIRVARQVRGAAAQQDCHGRKRSN